MSFEGCLLAESFSQKGQREKCVFVGMQQHPMVVGDFLVNVEGQIEATMSKLLLRTERHPEITQISDLVCLPCSLSL